MDSLASCSDVVTIWNTGGGGSGGGLGRATTVNVPAAVTNSCCWNHNGQVVATAGDDGSITVLKLNGKVVPAGVMSAHEIWDLKRNNSRATRGGHRSPVTCVAFFERDTHVAAGDKGGRVLLHRVDSSSDQSPVPLPRAGAHARVTDLSVAASGSTALSVSHSDGSVRIWDTARGDLTREMGGQHRGAATAISFHPHGSNMVATAGQDGVVRCTDTRAADKGGRVLRSTETGVPLTCLSFHSEGLILAVGASNGTVRLIDLRVPAEAGSPQVAYAGPVPPPGGVRDVAFQRPLTRTGSNASSGARTDSSGRNGHARHSAQAAGESAGATRARSRPASAPRASSNGSSAAGAAARAASATRSQRKPGDGREGADVRPGGSEDDGEYAGMSRSSASTGWPRGEVPGGRRAGANGWNTPDEARMDAAERDVRASNGGGIGDGAGMMGARHDGSEARGRGRSTFSPVRDEDRLSQDWVGSASGEPFGHERRVSRSPRDRRLTHSPERDAHARRRNDRGIDMAAGEREEWTTTRRAGRSSPRARNAQSPPHSNGRRGHQVESPPRESRGNARSSAAAHARALHASDQGEDLLSPAPHATREAGADVQLGHWGNGVRRGGSSRADDTGFDSPVRTPGGTMASRQHSSARGAEGRWIEGSPNEGRRAAVTSPKRSLAAAPAAAPEVPAGGMDRSMLEQVLSSHVSGLREELRQELRNLHVDMLRQFHSLQDEQAAAMSGFEERLGGLVAENQALRAENDRLRRVY